MSPSKPSLNTRPSDHTSACRPEIATLASLLGLDKQASLGQSIFDALSEHYELDSQQFERSEQVGLISHQSLVSALFESVPCPSTEYRSEAQRKVIQKGGQVEAWIGALKLAKDTKDEDIIHMAEEELYEAVEGSVAAWTTLVRCTLDDRRALDKKLARLEDARTEGKMEGTNIYI